MSTVSSAHKEESGFIIPLLLAIIVIVVIVVIVNSGKAKPAYTASETGIAVVDSSHVSVSFKVTNTGKASGEPTCLVKVNDPTSAHTGVDEAKMASAIAAGATTNSAMPITVTGNGASAVTAATVSCH